MKELFQKLSVLIFSLFSTELACAQLQINEIMQSNIDCIMDDLNEYPDSWIEIYNPSDFSYNLNEYKIGITNDISSAWTLPDTILSSHSYIIVYCDKVGEGIHSDFRLESGKGCCVYLFNNRFVVDSFVNIKKQPAPNISYGRKTENEEAWGYQQNPTPGKNNCGILCKELLGDPIFSSEGKVVFDNERISLELSLPNNSPQNAAIYYTVDGSEPTVNSIKYDTSIDISKSTVIRAKIFCEGFLSPRSVSQSYIFLPRNTSLPIISIMTDNDNLYDQEKGIYVKGTYSSDQENFQYNWRRPVNIEYFDGDYNNSCINQLCEMRIGGGVYSRLYKIKSLIIYANKRFGNKLFDYEFFKEDKPGIHNFKSLMLRNAGNDFYGLYMRDALIQRNMALHSDLDWQAYQPAIIFINGNYNGILNIRERGDEDNIYANYDGLNKLDIVENWLLLKEGTWDNFNSFRNFYSEEGHSIDEYEQYLDYVEFANLMIMNIFVNNQDFPGNNIIMWRPQAEGGQWRFIAKDTDFGLGLYNTDPFYKTLNWIYDPSFDTKYRASNEVSTKLFINLMKNEAFRSVFIDRFAIYMGDFLNSKGFSKLWRPMCNNIKEEYPYHLSLYSQGEFLSSSFEERFLFLDEWISNRTAFMYQHLKEKYDLGEIVDLIIHTEGDTKLFINSIPLHNNEFNGKYYAGRKLSLESPNGVMKWKVTLYYEDGTSTSCETNTTDQFEMVLPSCNKIEIAALDYQTDIKYIKEVDNGFNYYINSDFLILDNLHEGDNVNIYDFWGHLVYMKCIASKKTSIPLNTLGRGVFLIKTGRIVKKVIL